MNKISINNHTAFSHRFKDRPLHAYKIKHGRITEQSVSFEDALKKARKEQEMINKFDKENRCNK